MRLALPPNSCKVPTPRDLAQAIVAALGDKPGAKWLEPSHGSGVFIEEISKLGVQKERITAVDLEPYFSPADELATTHRRVDFLRWAASTNERFSRIVGNPPYVSIKRLPVSLKKTAAMIRDLDGNQIGFGSNVWYAFVLASMELLESGGSLAFVLPSSAMFADYSSEIRRVIGTKFGSLEIFRCSRSLFDNVQEGTLVAIAREYNENPCKVRRRNFHTRKNLVKGLAQSGNLSGRQCRAKSIRRGTSFVRLASIATIRLGGVTGDASYFLMNEEKRLRHKLPSEAFIPVLSKARHLTKATISKATWEKLRDSGERVWLFRPHENLRDESDVRRYLRLKSEKGGCNRDAYKISNREPWYQTPLPSKVDAFLSGMSQHGPWLCINGMKSLNATNTLYTVSFNCRDKSEWYRWALAFFTTTVQRQIRRIGRRYADGLIKYEPGALSQLELPRMGLEGNIERLYINAVDAFLKSDRVTAREIADSLVIDSNST